VHVLHRESCGLPCREHCGRNRNRQCRRGTGDAQRDRVRQIGRIQADGVLRRSAGIDAARGWLRQQRKAGLVPPDVIRCAPMWVGHAESGQQRRERSRERRRTPVDGVAASGGEVEIGPGAVEHRAVGDVVGQKGRIALQAMILPRRVGPHLVQRLLRLPRRAARADLADDHRAGVPHPAPAVGVIQVVVDGHVLGAIFGIADRHPERLVVHDDVVDQPRVHAAVGIVARSERKTVERVGGDVVDVNHRPVAPDAGEHIAVVGVVVGQVAVGVDAAGVVHVQAKSAHPAHLAAGSARPAPALFGDVGPADAVAEDVAGDEHIAEDVIVRRAAPELQAAAIRRQLAGPFEDVARDENVAGFDLRRGKTIRLVGLDDRPGELDAVVRHVMDVIAFEAQLVDEAERGPDRVVAVGAKAQVVHLVVADDGVDDAGARERIGGGAVLPPVDQPNGECVDVGDLRIFQRKAVDDVLGRRGGAHRLFDVQAPVGVAQCGVADDVLVGFVRLPVRQIDRAAVEQLDRQPIQDGVGAVAQAEAIGAARNLDVECCGVGWGGRPQVKPLCGRVVPPFAGCVEQVRLVLDVVLASPTQAGIAGAAIVLADLIHRDAARADVVRGDCAAIDVVPLIGVDGDERPADQAAERG